MDKKYNTAIEHGPMGYIDDCAWQDPMGLICSINLWELIYGS
jgi:hypothetical protein